MKILIVKPGETAAAVQERHGDYDRWFIDAMPHPGLEFQVLDATRAPVPRLDGYQGVIVTGSASAVYRTTPWMAALERFLTASREQPVPILCVCFGAQMLAQALGGHVTLNPNGWEIGSVDVDLADGAAGDPLFAGLPRRCTALATHEDSIDRLPAGCTLLASNANTPVQAFRAGERLWGVQFHPEASVGIIESLIRLRADGLTLDAEDHGLEADGHAERLIGTLRRQPPNQCRTVLDNFVRVCRAG